MARLLCSLLKVPCDKSFKRLPLLLSLLVLAACSDDDRHDYQYTANVTRTEYGIPHISADG